MKTIFQHLSSIDLCYSVAVSVNSFKVSSNASIEREYFILAHKKDENKLNKLGFFDSEEHETIERNLSDIEVEEFKIILDKFDRTHSDSHGRIYELKDNSFRDYYSREFLKQEITKIKQNE